MKAHSVVLAAANSIFKSALKSSQKPEEHVIVLPGMELWILETIVHYMYTGNIQVREDYATEVHLSRLIDVLIEFGFKTSDDDLAAETRYSSLTKAVR